MSQPTVSWTQKFATLPSPMAGLALAIGSLGWTWENLAPLHGAGQLTGGRYCQRYATGSSG